MNRRLKGDVYLPLFSRGLLCGYLICAVCQALQCHICGVMSVPRLDYASVLSSQKNIPLYNAVNLFITDRNGTSFRERKHATAYEWSGEESVKVCGQSPERLWACAEPMASGSHAMMPAKKSPSIELLSQRGATDRTATTCDCSDLRNRCRWRCHVFKSRGQEMAQGPCALGK